MLGSLASATLSTTCTIMEPQIGVRELGDRNLWVAFVPTASPHKSQVLLCRSETLIL